jgi:hypothetical protein
MQDGEFFPVRRKLLRPCIALTAAVRSAEDAPLAQVEVDTPTFDRWGVDGLERKELGGPPGGGLELRWDGGLGTGDWSSSVWTDSLF